MSYLQSDSEGGSINLIRVADQGSKPHHAKVMVQGVPTYNYGVIDTGADITIMGGDLFKLVPSVNKLKKSAFKKPDKVPRPYNQQTFTLDGCIDLEVVGRDMHPWSQQSMSKWMHACDQLLLGEGLCRQLDIVT